MEREKKEIKISGQSKIEVNPKADIGQYWIAVEKDSVFN